MTALITIAALALGWVAARLIVRELTRPLDIPTNPDWDFKP